MFLTDLQIPCKNAFKVKQILYILLQFLISVTKQFYKGKLKQRETSLTYPIANFNKLRGIASQINSQVNRPWPCGLQKLQQNKKQ